MLKVVKLLKLYVENFRGIKNFVLTPDGRSATVQGGNGTGKSTLIAAFLWLLTGKMCIRDRVNNPVQGAVCPLTIPSKTAMERIATVMAVILRNL